MKSNFLLYILILSSLWVLLVFGFILAYFFSDTGLVIFALIGISWMLIAAGLMGPKRLKTRMREFQIWSRTKAVIFFPVHPHQAIDEALKGGIKEFVPTKERIKNFLILNIITLIFVVILIIGGFFAWHYFGALKEEANIPKIETPEKIVSQFYQGYLRASNCGPREGCGSEMEEYIKLNNDLEKDYKERLLEEEIRLVDPVLWAQDMPPEDNLQVSNAMVNGDTALINVTFLPIWPNHKLKVSLSLIGNEWKINNIIKIVVNAAKTLFVLDRIFLYTG